MGESWCTRCVRETDILPPALALDHPPSLLAAAATGTHTGKLRNAVQALKYENARSVALPLARRMTRVLARLGWMYDTILPVPIGAARLRERGYNQAGLIAAALAEETGVAFQPTLIWRTRETPTQVGLTAEQRRQNVAGAFQAHPSQFQDKTVLLIDDVYTTGATMGACAESIRAVGAVHVFALAATAAQSNNFADV